MTNFVTGGMQNLNLVDSSISRAITSMNDCTNEWTSKMGKQPNEVNCKLSSLLESTVDPFFASWHPLTLQGPKHEPIAQSGTFADALETMSKNCRQWHFKSSYGGLASWLLLLKLAHFCTYLIDILTNVQAAEGCCVAHAAWMSVNCVSVALASAFSSLSVSCAVFSFFCWYKWFLQRREF